MLKLYWIANAINNCLVHEAQSNAPLLRHIVLRNSSKPVCAGYARSYGALPPFLVLHVLDWYIPTCRECFRLAYAPWLRGTLNIAINGQRIVYTPISHL